MDLTYKVRGLVGQTHAVRIPFQPPLSGYEEVKPRLLGMTADAYEALGMVSELSTLTKYNETLTCIYLFPRQRHHK